MNPLLWIPLLVVAPLGDAPSGEPSAAETCLGCHGDKDLKSRDGSGRARSLFVDASKLKASTHKDMDCSSCHPGLTADNHTSGEKRGHGKDVRQACLGCHEPDEGLHGRMITAPNAPSCTTCHGTHAIRRSKRSRHGCMNCHEHYFEGPLPGGDRVSLRVDHPGLASSAHQSLSCQACHASFTDKAHPKSSGSTRVERARNMNRACRSCHTSIQEHSLGGVHAQLPSHQADRVPSCTDCHGAHDVGRANLGRFQVANRCKSCHEREHSQFTGSVHGAAMTHGKSQDLPTCADCHRAHDTERPSGAGDRARMHEMCGKCHSDKARMKRFGLSPEVVNSYLDDFHGVTLKYYSKEKRSTRSIATCVDCHGIHDIHSAKGTQAKGIKARLLARCRSCHPKASVVFPDAWVSHWVPSPSRTPIVWVIQWFYKIIIPLMFVGLGLQVLLHFWRYAVKR